MIEFKLPAIGEGIIEGEIVRWLKQPGDLVAANEGIVEIMTDKATVEIPCPQTTTLSEIRVAEGTIVAVGEVIALFDGASPTSPTPPTSSPRVAPEKPAPARPPQPARPAETRAPQRDRSVPVAATPAARALARETGIDLSTLAPAGGRITKVDVESASKTVTPTDDTFIPFRGMRRRIAEGMSKSYATAVHYTYVEEVNVGRLMTLRAEARALAQEEGVSISYLPFITKAVVAALKRFPIVNAFLAEDQSQIVLRKQYNIGIATTTAEGLMVPVLHDADKLSLITIASEIQRLSDAARAGKASRHELTGSTFTITSLGAIGGILATPILNFPEVGILGVHAIRKTPVVNDRDEIVVGHVMNLSVSLDHRVVDGFEGANFLQEIKRYLENPTLLWLTAT